MKIKPGITSQLLRIGALVLLVIAPTQFSFEVAPKVHLSPVDPLVWLIFALWAWQGIREDPKRLIRLPLFGVLLIGVALLSAVNAVSRLTAFKDVVQFAEYFLAGFLIFRTVMQDKDTRRTLVWAFLVTGTVIVVWGAAHYGALSIPALDVRATFGNRNVLGGYLSLLLPLLLSVCLYEKRWPLCIWLLLTVLIGAFSMLSGGAFIGIAVSLAIVAAIRGRAALVGYTIAALLVVVAILPHLPRNNLDLLFQSIALFGDDGELLPRYPEWQAATIMILENPWLGVGIGNYQLNIGSYYGTVPDLARAAEPDIQNLYLVLASSIGLTGLVCYTGMLLTAGRTALLTVWQSNGWNKALALGACGSLIAFSISSIWSPLLVRGIGIPLAFILALAMSPKGAEAA